MKICNFMHVVDIGMKIILDILNIDVIFLCKDGDECNMKIFNFN